jgi:uncharacterized membrane protein
MDSAPAVSSRSAIGLFPRRRFIAFHKWDRNFFLIFLAVCWLGVALGFIHPALKRYAGQADYPAPLILQIHATSFAAWLLLLTAQITLIRTRNPLLHMKLGLIGFALVPIMAVSAFFSEVYSQRFYFVHPPNSQAFFILPIFYVIAFTTLAAAALASRCNPGAHKRLILLATTIIVGAAYARWWGRYTPIPDTLGGMLINTFAGTDLLLAFALGYDWLTRRRLHPVYELAVPLIVTAEVATTFISHSPRWLPIARLAIGH